MYRFALPGEAAEKFLLLNDSPFVHSVITVLASPYDGTLWYSDYVWRDATFAWQVRRHTGGSFWRMTPEILAQLPEDVHSFTPGEWAEYIKEGA
jgi:hypothetical protein